MRNDTAFRKPLDDRKELPAQKGVQGLSSDIRFTGMASVYENITALLDEYRRIPHSSDSRRRSPWGRNISSLRGEAAQA